MTDPLAYGEGLGASVIILAGFLGVLALAQLVAYLRHQALPALIAMLTEVQRRQAAERLANVRKNG